MLHDCGLNIEHYESTQNKYYYDGQTFDLAELKVLVDAISASKYYPAEMRRAHYKASDADNGR